MIQLNPTPRPKQLTDEKVQTLIKEFIETGKVVWKQPYVKKALLEMSNHKCCYCECPLEVADSYCEIEHFHPKSLYPNEVLEWENLLPSCKRCNGTKGKHDTKLEPIIHPVKENPKEHLKLKAYRFYEKTDIGKQTIQTLDLNNRIRLVEIRARLGFELIDQLENLAEEIEDNKNLSTNRKQRIRRTIKKLMLETTPSSDYSATLATTLLTCESYIIIKTFLQSEDFWTTEFSKLERKIDLYRLDEA